MPQLLRNKHKYKIACCRLVYLIKPHQLQDRTFGIYPSVSRKSKKYNPRLSIGAISETNRSKWFKAILSPITKRVM